MVKAFITYIHIENEFIKKDLMKNNNEKIIDLEFLRTSIKKKKDEIGDTDYEYINKKLCEIDSHNDEENDNEKKIDTILLTHI